MFPKFLSVHKKTIAICIASLLLLTSCAVKTPTINSPTISSEKAESIYDQAKFLDNSFIKSQTEIYQLYKKACFQGNHLQSCLELEKNTLNSKTMMQINIDELVPPAEIAGHLAGIYNQQCQEGNYQGCFKLAKLLKSKEYQNYFKENNKSGEKSLYYLIDIPLAIATLGLYAILCPFDMCASTGFVANNIKSLNKLADETKKRGDQLLLQGCENGNADDCFFAKKYKKGCRLGNLDACSYYINSIENDQIHSEIQENKRMCGPENANACLIVAKIYEKQKKNDDAKNFANQACRYGMNKACYFYSDLQLFDSPKESLKILADLCKKNEKLACEKISMTAQQYKKSNPNIAKIFSKGSCEFNDVSGCSLYADLHIETNFDEATKPLKKLCENDELLACEKMADIFLERNTKTDKLEAIKYLKNALSIQSVPSIEKKLEKTQNQLTKMDDFQKAKQGCSNNNTKACFQLADFYFNGEEGVAQQDKKKALELYADLCIKNKNAEFCKTAGDIHKQEKKYALANNFYIKSIVLTNKNLDTAKLDPTGYIFRDRLMSCNISLNVSIEHRRGFDSDARCYSELCKDGYLYGCTMTNILGKEFLQDKNYSRRYPVRQDYFKAKEIFEENCKNGYGLSCIYLSNMFFNGKGVKTDKAKAKEIREEGIKLLTKSCSFENGDDCTYLANETLDANPKKAFALYTKGCELGNSFACVQIGAMYEKGIGTAKNMGKAKDFYGKACDFQDQEGCSNYNRLSQ